MGHSNKYNVTLLCKYLSTLITHRALEKIQCYFTPQIFECLDKIWRHSQQCNAISLCKYLSVLKNLWAFKNIQRYFTLEISECFDKTWWYTNKCNVISLCKYQTSLVKHGGTRKHATVCHSANIRVL